MTAILLTRRWVAVLALVVPGIVKWGRGRVGWSKRAMLRTVTTRERAMRGGANWRRSIWATRYRSAANPASIYVPGATAR